MAEVIEFFDFEPRGSGTRYPWDKWLNGQIWKLVRGVDFKSEPSRFRQTLNSHAFRKGLAIRTSVRGDAVYVQLIKDAASKTPAATERQEPRE